MNGKRLLDLAVGIPMTIALAPVLAVIGTLLLVTAGRPVLLVQTRVGAAERPIRVLKFRTMRRGTPTVAKSVVTRMVAWFTSCGERRADWRWWEVRFCTKIALGSSTRLKTSTSSGACSPPAISTAMVNPIS